ncbi:MAG: pyruvate formate lyase family protein [Planctomycetota bacterium]|jgi:formate C-acetyltransferase
MTELTTRVRGLRERMVAGEHLRHRVAPPEDWAVGNMSASMAERRAESLRMLCEKMPVAIEPDELIVGMRTIARPDPRENTWPVLPEFYRDEEEKSIYHFRSSTHNVPGYAKVFAHGFGGLAQMSRDRLAEETDEGKCNALRSFIMACETVGLMSRRYADLATEMAETAEGQRRKDLLAIADVCGHVATGRPRHLHDALQLYWWTWQLTTLEVGCLVTLGRFDQVVEPHWPTDSREHQRARELLDCFVIKCNDQDDLWKEHSLVNNTLMLSGLKPDGSDGTNAVTWAVLDSVRRLKLPDPQPAVRLHADSPPELVRTVCELWREGLSQISVYNDDTFVPAMAELGFPVEDARDYAVDACQDVNIFGKSDFYTAGSVPMAQTLLAAMESAGDIDSWDAFYAHFKQCLAAAIAKRLSDYMSNLHLPGGSCPLLSVAMDDCIETGLDASDGGLRYRDKGVFLGEPVCTINSLAAIRDVVYDKKLATLAEVRDACEADFEGAETLREHLKAAPKWGNDDDAVDLIGRDLVAFGCREVNSHRLPDGSRLLAGVHQAHHVAVGAGLPATPDGRHEGDRLSPTMAPAIGTETKGPTAVMRSATKIDTLLCQWNYSLTMTFDPVAIAGEDGLAKFMALVKTFLAMGGPQLQINCVNPEMLRAAQADPDAHRDLVVRVWGFCDRFVALLPEYQQEIIDRTAHRL